MIINYLTWHKVKVHCPGHPDKCQEIKDAAVTVNDTNGHGCTINSRKQDISLVYSSAEIKSISPWEMVISAKWFSSTYTRDGQVGKTILIPVEITCSFEER